MKKTLAISAAAAAIVLPLAMFAYFYYELFPAPAVNPNSSGDLGRMMELKAGRPMRLAVLGDCRGNTEAMERIIEDARERGADAAFILGDIVLRGTPGRYRYIKREISEAAGPMKVLTVIGNHDLDRRDSSRLFEKYFGPTHYWLRYQGLLFVAVDNVQDEVWTEELEWLRSMLKERARPGDAIFLLMHKPPRPEGDKDFYGMSQDKSRELWGAVSAYPGVKIFAGHIHDHMEYEFNGVPVWVNGEAGAPQKKDQPSYGYLFLECNSRDCSVQHVVLGRVPWCSAFLERFALYYFFWGWPLIPVAVIVVMIKKRRRPQSPAIDPLDKG